MNALMKSKSGPALSPKRRPFGAAATLATRIEPRTIGLLPQNPAEADLASKVAAKGFRSLGRGVVMVDRRVDVFRAGYLPTSDIEDLRRFARSKGVVDFDPCMEALAVYDDAEEFVFMELYADVSAAGILPLTEAQGFASAKDRREAEDRE